MDGSEGLSSLFAYSLLVRVFQDTVDPAALINQRVDWQLRVDEETWRPFNGMVASYSGGEAMARGQRSFQLTTVPWLWFLQHRQDSRVFQNQTTVQIATGIFDEMGYSDYDTSGLANEYQPRQYCVQYRETDYNFVSRLFEEEGIFYYWKHETGKHTLMLADGAHAYKDVPGSSLPYNPPGIFKNSVTGWMHHNTFRSGKTTTNDYDFQNPNNSLVATTTGSSPVPSADKYEIFDFPGRYVQRDHGEKVSSRMMAGHEKGQDTISSSSASRDLAPGGRFALEAHPVAAENVQYAITSIVHHASDPSFESVAKGAPGYHNTFTCMPATVDFTPEQRTEKPVIPGIQSAVVTGPQGEEIYTDRYGRVKVQFHWDRKGKNDESSSCWVRVAQPWAGKGFGAQTIPRIGMEVLVGFMEGDPDHPVIVGSLPNANTIPSIKLPDEKERTAFRSSQQPGRRRLQRADLRGQEGLGGAVPPRAEGHVRAGRQQQDAVGRQREPAIGRDAVPEHGARQHDRADAGPHPDQARQQPESTSTPTRYGSISARSHVLTLDANGIHLHSTARVDASQGAASDATNWVSITGSGVDAHGNVVQITAGASGADQDRDGGFRHRRDRYRHLDELLMPFEGSKILAPDHGVQAGHDGRRACTV